MQLQSLQNPFSFYSNPALWPKLHPFQEKMIQQSLQSDLNDGPNPVMQNALPSPHVGQGQKDEFYKPTTASRDVLNQQDGAKIKSPKVDLLENPLNNGSVPFIGSGNNPLHSSSIAPRAEGVDQTNVGIQQVCAIHSELDDILNNRSMCYIPQEDQIAEFDCLREMNGSKDNLIWWSNDSADTKSASSNSWESSATPVLLPEGMFQDYELGYSLQLQWFNLISGCPDSLSWS